VLNFLALWILFLVFLPWYIGKFTFEMFKRNYCISNHWNLYIQSGANSAHCPKCNWDIKPYDWN